jgi:5,10-methylenetetrahydrofolate reductase
MVCFQKYDEVKKLIQHATNQLLQAGADFVITQYTRSNIRLH